MPDVDRPSFPPAMPHSLVDHEARSRIGALEADMRGLRNQVDNIGNAVSSLRDNQASMQAGLSSANTNLEWLRQHHEKQEREKPNKPDPWSNNKIVVTAMGVIVLLANLIAELMRHLVGLAGN